MEEELEARLESEIARQAQEEPESPSSKPPIVLVKCSLPSLQNPLTGLFEEALSKKGLTIAQKKAEEPREKWGHTFSALARRLRRASA